MTASSPLVISPKQPTFPAMLTAISREATVDRNRGLRPKPQPTPGSLCQDLRPPKALTKLMSFPGAKSPVWVWMLMWKV